MAGGIVVKNYYNCGNTLLRGDDASGAPTMGSSGQIVSVVAMSSLHQSSLVQASLARAEFVFPEGFCTNFVPPSRERWHFRNYCHFIFCNLQKDNTRGKNDPVSGHHHPNPTHSTRSHKEHSSLYLSVGRLTTSHHIP